MILSFPFIHQQIDPARGQVKLCHNLIATLFKKEIAHVRKNFPKQKSKDN